MVWGKLYSTTIRPSIQFMGIMDKRPLPRPESRVEATFIYVANMVS